MQTVHLSLIVPAYNDEDTLERTVGEALLELPSLYPSSEVVIVDDGSRDQTARIADGLAAANPERVRVIHMDKNQGFEAALKSGVHAAKGEKILFAKPH
jgi:glycosyltransferase involved in cell wall biosynthesis